MYVSMSMGIYDTPGSILPQLLKLGVMGHGFTFMQVKYPSIFKW